MARASGVRERVGVGVSGGVGGSERVSGVGARCLLLVSIGLDGDVKFVGCDCDGR